MKNILDPSPTSTALLGLAAALTAATAFAQLLGKTETCDLLLEVKREILVPPPPRCGGPSRSPRRPRRVFMLPSDTVPARTSGSGAGRAGEGDDHAAR